MSESLPFIFGGMTKPEGFEVCPYRGENRRQNDIKKSSCFNWVIFQIAEKMLPLQWFWATNLYHKMNDIKIL